MAAATGVMLRVMDVVHVEDDGRAALTEQRRRRSGHVERVVPRRHGRSAAGGSLHGNRGVGGVGGRTGRAQGRIAELDCDPMTLLLWARV